jgi:transposase InsO family protein
MRSTQGKIERYHRSMKNLLLSEFYYLPQQLEQRIGEWVEYYNYHRYHESLDNLTPPTHSLTMCRRNSGRGKNKKLTLAERRKSYIHQQLQNP